MERGGAGDSAGHGAGPDGARGAETALGADVTGQRVRKGEPGFGAAPGG